MNLAKTARQPCPSKDVVKGVRKLLPRVESLLVAPKYPIDTCGRLYSTDIAKAQAIEMETLFSSVEIDGTKRTVKFANFDVVGDFLSRSVDTNASRHFSRPAEVLLRP
jgi:hypothetical protein